LKMEYWNPYLETLPKDALTKIELAYFRKIFSFAREHSRLYRDKLEEIDPEEIRTMADLKEIPLTEKEEMRRYQEMEPFPYGGLLAGDIEEVTTFRQTSGTTGKPIYVPETYESWQWRIEAWCHILYMAGFRRRHRIFLPFGYNVYVAFWEAHFASEKVGCELVQGGALDTRGRIHKILEVKADGLMNTPTYGLHIASEAKAMGIDPAALGIERMLCAGEPMTTATRTRLEELYRCQVFDHIGGTEPCAWAAMCGERDGLHIIEPFFLVEILDRETMRREVAEGETGVAVVTPLGRRSFPLIRFNTKDLVRKMKDVCPCGRTSLKIKEVLGRIDEIRKVRGVLFSPKTAEEVIRKDFPEIEEFEIIIERLDLMDVITLKAEVPAGLSVKAGKETRSRLENGLKIATNLTFNVIIKPPGSLPRYLLKAKRFKDLREGMTHE